MHGLLATLWFSGPVDHRQRADREAHRHEQRRQRARPGQPRQRDDRARAAARDPQRRRRRAGRDRPRGVRQPGQVHVLLRRGRVRSDVDAAQRRARIQARHLDGHACSTATACRASPREARARPKGWRARSRWGSRAVCHPKLARVVGRDPRHLARPLRDLPARAAGGAPRSRRACAKALRRPGRDLVQGAHGVEEGIDPARAEEMVDKFNEGGLLVVRAGGRGGLMSAVIGGWSAQRKQDRSADRDTGDSAT